MYQSFLSNKLEKYFVLFPKEYTLAWVHFTNYILNAFITIFLSLQVNSQTHRYLHFQFQLKGFPCMPSLISFNFYLP